MKDQLIQLIGNLPLEEAFKHRMRFHQGWWRACVLVEEQGKYPAKKEGIICNTISQGEANHKNFLTTNILRAVSLTQQERKLLKTGILEENRLFNNLLSSQPLCFNFFGELKMDMNFALQVLKQFWNEITEVKNVLFEFSPNENYLNDHSAFDVAFEVMVDDKHGLIGLECKYTDTFSAKEYDKEEYRRIFDDSKGSTFLASFDKLKSGQFNQLFRNQLIAEALRLDNRYDFIYTGLFCHQDDQSAIKTGKEFQQMLKNGDHEFTIITYQDYLEKVQRLDIPWDKRELSMLLWTRYCGLKLSEQAFQ